MKYGPNDVPDLSIQQLISCNYLTEGCNGGWGILNGFFAENVGLIKEECAPYEGQPSKCGSLSQCEEVARVSSTYFVEKSETGIQKEILKNGMVDISMAFPQAAAHYKSGILSSHAQLHAADTIDELKHATVIVGWGAEKDIKYWIL